MSDEGKSPVGEFSADSNSESVQNSEQANTSSMGPLISRRSHIAQMLADRGILRSSTRFLFYILLLLVIITPLLVRIRWEGQAELQRATLAMEQGDREREVLHLGRAARWRMPAADHDEIALERLIRMGVQAESDPDLGRDFALVAYREARRAILATRAWGLSSPENFDLINRRIARLMAEQEKEFQTDLSGQGKQSEYHLQLLQKIPGQGSRGTFLSSVAFVLWAIALLGFVTQAIDLRGNLRAKRALCWGGMSLVLLITWTVLTRYPESIGSFEDSQIKPTSMLDEP